MKYGYIYKTTFLKNGLFYIGQHVASEFDTKYIGSGKKLTTLIREHGKYDECGNPNFSCELIEWANSRNELNSKEIYWINKLDARNPIIGLNIARGGTLINLEHTAEARAAISAAQLGCVFLYKGNRLTRVSQDEAKLLTKNGWNYGRVGGRARSIICLETKQVWQAENHLAKSLGITSGELRSYFNTRPYQGLHYCYIDTYEAWSDLERNQFLRKQSINPRKPVLCVELNKIFPSIKEASIEMKICRQLIRDVCHNKPHKHTAGGYHWKFIEKEEIKNNG